MIYGAQTNDAKHEQIIILDVNFHQIFYTLIW